MARWTDLAEWVGPTPNHGGAPRSRRGLVVHIAAGYYLGTIAWQKRDDVDVSSTFVVAGPRDKPYGVADGKLGQVVDTDHIPWTQGDGNPDWLSVECSGFVGDSLSAAQIESIAQLLARGHREYGWPLAVATDPRIHKGLGHHGMGATHGLNWGHPDCPGPRIIAQKPLIVARASQIVNGEDDMGFFDEGTNAEVAAWRLEAMAYGRAKIAGGPEKGKLVPGAAAALAAQTELAALRGVVQTLADALKAGGGSVDTAAVLAGVDQRLAAFREQVRSDVDAELDEAFTGGADTAT